MGAIPRTEEVDVFARKVAARLKPNSLTEFANLIEHEILPWLRTQEGFVDLITLAAADGIEVATISFWDREGNAQGCNSSDYPEMLKILEKILDAPPYVKTFEVVRATLQLSAQRSALSTQHSAFSLNTSV